MKATELEKKICDKKTIEVTFIALIIILNLLMVYNLTSTEGTQQREIVYPEKQDYFMDYFNVIKYTSERDPYNSTFNGLAEKPYPPMTYMMLYPSSKLFDYISNGPKEARNDQLALLSLVLLLVFSSFAFSLILYELKNGSKIIRLLTVFSLLLSGIFIFTIERGNIVIVSSGLIGFFLLFYKSDNKILKELAFISLAIAASMKVYPALFGLLLLYEKRYNEAGRLVFYGLAATLLPFLFFKGGFANIYNMLHNMALNTNAYFLNANYRFGFITVGIILAYLTNQEISQILLISCLLLTIVCAIITIASSWSMEKQWKKILMITCMIVLTPINSGFYNGLLFFIPIIMFLNDNQHKISDWFYLFMIILVLNPFQITINGSGLSPTISNFAAIEMYFVLCIEGINNLIIKAKQRNRNNAMRNITKTR